MSKFTTEVRYICEEAAGLQESVGLDDIDFVLSKTNVDKVFEKIDYPIFDENYRYVLNKKILMHYYTREIGLETVGLWKLKMRTKLNEIMPYYNQLYKSELIEFNPLYDVKVSTKGKRDNKGTSIRSDESNNKTKSKTDNKTSSTGISNSESSSSRSEWDKYSDTPQGGLDNFTPNGDNEIYLTNIRNKTGSESDKSSDTSMGSSKGQTEYEDEVIGNSSGTNVANNTEEYLEEVEGTRGGISFSKRLLEYRQTFINIDMQIIDELNSLFFGLWE